MRILNTLFGVVGDECVHVIHPKPIREKSSLSCDIICDAFPLDYMVCVRRPSSFGMRTLNQEVLQRIDKWNFQFIAESL
jgi:hypothetical protein